MYDKTKLEEQISAKTSELERLKAELKEIDKDDRRRGTLRRFEQLEDAVNALRRDLFLEGGLS